MIVLLPPVEVPLDADHERQALIALAELLPPLFHTSRVGPATQRSDLPDDA